MSRRSAGAEKGVVLARAWRRGAALPLAAALLLGACAGPAGSPAPRQPVFPGFDTSIYPGDAVVRRWRAESPYRWIGFYLPAPCHRETSWSGKKQTLEGMGWGIALLYVGQQAFEGSAPPDSAAGTPILCSRTLLTPEQGRRDAQDAISRAQQEGFAAGSVIFLDVESMRVIPDSMRAYYSAWQRTLISDGRFVPGTYAHQRNAVPLYALAEPIFREGGRTGTPPFWVAGGSRFALDRPPWSIGLPFVTIWQGTLDVDRSWGGSTLKVDENVATSPSPSAPPIP